MGSMIYCKRANENAKVNRDIIRQMKEAVSMPIIGNGNVETAADLINLMNGFADEMMEREQVAVSVSAV
ncbi:tRNA-dihydrouridine synthase [Sporosarcina sp. FSL K6-1540]|uniref:tRNA-dihydrouridine synthase n=1 Tax=Sporosarcina sp. FSL K6-1540 TaxID=2921555 RepID=UPI003159A97D